MSMCIPKETSIHEYIFMNVYIYTYISTCKFPWRNRCTCTYIEKYFDIYLAENIAAWQFNNHLYIVKLSICGQYVNTQDNKLNAYTKRAETHHDNLAIWVQT